MRTRRTLLVCLWVLVSLFAGLVLACLTALVPQFYWSQRSSASQTCSRVWAVEEGKVGVVLRDNREWWLPIDRETATIELGKLVLSPWDDDRGIEHFEGPVIALSHYEGKSLPINTKDITTDAPDWYTQALPLLPSTAISHDVTRISAGWPARCFEGTSVFGLHGSTHSVGLFSSDQGLIYLFRDNPIPIPYLPIPHALLINTLFWGTLFAGFMWLCRRVIRRFVNFLRPGSTFCHRCRYPRTGLRPNDPCPECGQAPTRLAPSISA